MEDRLSPRRLALGQLIEMYATYRAEDSHSFPLQARQQLALILMGQVSGDPQSSTRLNDGSVTARERMQPSYAIIEPSYTSLLEALHPLASFTSSSSSFVEVFQQKLLDLSEPDDLWTLMTSLGDLMDPPLTLDSNDDPEGGPMSLDRASVLGMYVRRLLLSFRRSTFEALCTLTTHFGTWVRQLNQQALPPPAASLVLGAEALPSWAHTLPLKQLEACVHRLVDQAESDLGDFKATEMKSQVDELLLYAPHIPQVHYLNLLVHLNARSFEEAEDEFHRYFDSVRSSSTAVAGVTPSSSHGKEGGRPLTQWASLNLARLHLSFGHRQQAVIALQEAMRSAQQHDDNNCLAYALLLLGQAHEGAGADGWGDIVDESEDGTLTAAAGAERQKGLLQRCLARAHELQLPELAALASEALALRSIGVAAAPGVEHRNSSAAPEPVLSVGRAPCLPPAPLRLPGPLPALPAAQPPPLHVWEALRCGAEGCGSTVQLVRACAWERFGNSRLASLHASLQLRYHKPAASRPSFGREWLKAAGSDRILAACKLAMLQEPQQGEAAALQSLLELRDRCSWGPMRNVWLQHTVEVLLRGALMRGERRRASDLLNQFKELLTVTDSAADAAWQPQLELMLQEGNLLEGRSPPSQTHHSPLPPFLQLEKPPSQTSHIPPPPFLQCYLRLKR